MVDVDTRAEPTTLAEHLESDSVGFGELHGTYGPMLHIVEQLIGVIPDCDPYLEIWPPGFRTYNLLVPNFLNLPASVVGRSGLKALMGLAMYTSSRAAGCAYCSAHCCSYALRRGASPEAVDGSSRTEAEAAVVALAESLSSVPATFEPSIADEVGKHLAPADVEWIALSIGMMGFLNKVMDALGIPLETEAIEDVAALIGPTGWSVGQHAWRNGDGAGAVKAVVPTDSIKTYGKVMKAVPGAVKLERTWTSHLPKTAPDLRRFLRDIRHVDVPLLSRIRHQRPMRSLAAMLDQNLDPSRSELGIGDKALAGLVFAATVGNQELRGQALGLASAYEVQGSVVETALAFAETGTDASLAGADERTQTVIRLAAAMAPSPAMVSSELAASAASRLPSAEIVELATWLSVQQLLHRMGLFYGSTASSG